MKQGLMKVGDKVVKQGYDIGIVEKVSPTGRAVTIKFMTKTIIERASYGNFFGIRHLEANENYDEIYANLIKAKTDKEAKIKAEYEANENAYKERADKAYKKNEDSLKHDESCKLVINDCTIYTLIAKDRHDCEVLLMVTCGKVKRWEGDVWSLAPGIVRSNSDSDSVSTFKGSSVGSMGTFDAKELVDAWKALFAAL